MTTYHYGSPDVNSRFNHSRSLNPVYRTTYDTHLNYATNINSHPTSRRYESGLLITPSRHSDNFSVRSRNYGIRKPSHSYSSSPLVTRVMPSYLSNNRLSYQHLLDQIAQITDQLFLSSINAINIDRVRELGVTMIVSLITEPPPIRASNVENVMVPIEDNEYANLSSYLDRILERMHREEVRGGKILVHCIAGVSRSSSLVMAYLMKYHAMRLRQAYNHTRARRPYIQPNIGFWKQLIDYEKRLFGVPSVKLVPSRNDPNILLADVPPSALSSVICNAPPARHSNGKSYSVSRLNY